MILIDTDIFVIDRRYFRDAKFQINRRFLNHLKQHEIEPLLFSTCMNFVEL